MLLTGQVAVSTMRWQSIASYSVRREISALILARGSWLDWDILWAQMHCGFSYIIGIFSCWHHTRLLLQRLQPIFPFLSLIIVEPMISAGDGHDLDQLRERLVKSAQDRKSEWTSREAALLFLKANPGTMKWDEQVLKAFVVRYFIWLVWIFAAFSYFWAESCDRRIPFGQHCQACLYPSAGTSCVSSAVYSVGYHLQLLRQCTQMFQVPHSRCRSWHAFVLFSLSTLYLG